MNILNNKELLRGLLRQSEIINTINGGSCLTSYEIIKTNESHIIKIKAPSVSPEAFNVVLNNNELVIFTVSLIGAEEKTDDELMASPMFLKQFKVPANADTDKIEAIHEENELRVILPFHQNHKNKLRQIIVKQI